MSISEDVKAKIKDAYIAEFTSARAEWLQRVGAQGTAVGWSITLTGAFLGACVAIKTPGSSLFFDLIGPNPPSGVVFTFAVLCFAYTVGLQLLLSYYSYQLHVIGVLHDQIESLSKRYTKLLDVGDNLGVFAGDRGEWPLELLKRTVRHGTKREKAAVWHVVMSFKVVKWIQPLLLYALMSLGIFLVRQNWQLLVHLPGVPAWQTHMVSILFWVLTIVFLLQLAVHLGVSRYRWRPIRSLLLRDSAKRE